MGLPSISIVIPTRNSEKTLERCLRSIDEQDYPKEKMKLIIVDAFSSDKTVEIAEVIGVKFNSIETFFSNNNIPFKKRYIPQTNQYKSDRIEPKGFDVALSAFNVSRKNN